MWKPGGESWSKQFEQWWSAQRLFTLGRNSTKYTADPEP